MITLLVEENNTPTPDFYDSIISRLQLHRLTCPCGMSGCLSVHGYYHRYMKFPSGKLLFSICRVICSCCGHTHALLLSAMVPYSQVSAADQAAVIRCYTDSLPLEPVMDRNPTIDEGCCRYIIACYRRHWHERLLSERISLTPLHGLVRACFSHFSRQFMQIKSTPNILFADTT